MDVVRLRSLLVLQLAVTNGVRTWLELRSVQSQLEGLDLRTFVSVGVLVWFARSNSLEQSVFAGARLIHPHGYL